MASGPVQPERGKPEGCWDLSRKAPGKAAICRTHLWRSLRVKMADVLGSVFL